jgi:hypothetical protein
MQVRERQPPPLVIEGFVPVLVTLATSLPHSRSADRLLDANRVGDILAMRFGRSATVLSCSLFVASSSASAVARSGPVIAARRVPADTASGAAGAMKSGSRITVERRTGPVSWERFHDELLDMDCVLLPATDGVTRCLPGPGASNAFNRVFADASCTIPVAQVWEPVRSDRSYLIRQDPGTANPWSEPNWSYQVFRKGAEYLAGPVFNNGNSCVEGMRTRGHRYFKLADVEPAKFVAFTKRDGIVPAAAQGRAAVAAPTAPAESESAAPLPEASGSRINVTWSQLVGADGTVTAPTEELRDEKLGTGCDLRVASDGVIRCLPSNPSIAGGYDWQWSAFADPSCRIPLARGPNPRKHPKPSYAVEWTTVEGKSAEHFFPIAGEYPASAPVFSPFPGKCTEVERLPFHWYFAVGPELAAAEFVAFSKRTLLSTTPTSAEEPTAVDASRITVIRDQFVGADGSTTPPMNARYRDGKAR